MPGLLSIPMPRNNPISLSDFHRVIALSAVFFPLFFINIFLLSVPFPAQGVLFTGSLFALLFSRLSTIDEDMKTGYIQSGEGAWGMLTVLVLTVFFSPHRLVAAALCISVLIAMEYYLHMIGRGTGREGIWSGLLMNAVALAAGVYVIIASGADSSKAGNVLMGYYRTAGVTIYEMIFFLGVFGTLYAALLFLSPEVSAFSQGKGFFELTGFGHKGARVGFIALRGFVVSGIVLFAGALSGVGFLAGIFREKNPVADMIKSVLVINLFLQIMVLLAALTSWKVAAPAAVLASYGLYWVYRKGYGYVGIQ